MLANKYGFGSLKAVRHYQSRYQRNGAGTEAETGTEAGTETRPETAPETAPETRPETGPEKKIQNGTEVKISLGYTSDSEHWVIFCLFRMAKLHNDVTYEGWHMKIPNACCEYPLVRYAEGPIVSMLWY